MLSRINRPITWVQDRLVDGWSWFLEILTTRNDFLITFTQISLYLTLFTSLIVLAAMLYVGPKRRLDQAFFLREIGIATVCSAVFAFRILEFFSLLWYVFGFVLLFIAAPYILFALWGEYRMTSDESTKRNVQEHTERYG